MSAIRASSIGSVERGNPWTAAACETDQFDGANIHAQRDGPRPLRGALATEPDETLSIEVRHFRATELAFEQVERRGLGSAGRLAHLFHVLDVQGDQILERLQAFDPRGCRRVALVDVALGLGRPGSRVRLS